MLTEIQTGFTGEAQYTLNSIHPETDSVVLWDAHSKQFWFVDKEEEVEDYFKFCGDLVYICVESKDALLYTYNYYAKHVSPFRNYSKTSFMLYSDELKIFDPYSIKSYPVEKYGKPIPRGMSIAKYDDRFARDLDVEEMIMKGYVCTFNQTLHERLLGIDDV